MHSAPPAKLQGKPQRAAIAVLTSNSTRDVSRLCVALESLHRLPDLANVKAGSSKAASVLIFHEDLSTLQQSFLEKCVSRKQPQRNVIFALLEYSFETFFPPDFDPISEQPNWSKRSKWGYHQMIRFWITSIWEHPALYRNYDTVMRLDSDACWDRSWWGPLRPVPQQLPGLPSPQTVYHANLQLREPLVVSTGFAHFVHDYVGKHNITVQNPRLWRRIPRDNQTAVPSFYNNFEVSRIDFMHRPEVRRFHRAMTEEEPFGVFRYRWGDALARYAVMALFAAPQEIVTRLLPPGGYFHPAGSNCQSKWEQAQERLQRMQSTGRNL